jgi:hypothetical protein
MKKWLPTILKGLAVFGGLVLAAILIRANKTSKASGGSTSFTQAAQDDIKNTIRMSTPAMVLIAIASALGMVFLLNDPNPVPGVSMALLWGSIAASATASFNITYVPQFIGFTITSAPTSFVINVQGDGTIFNLNANGITSMSNIRQVGVGTNVYVFQLADGLINGKNGTVSITNAAAAQLDIYAWSKDPGSFYLTYYAQRALQNSGIQLKKFAYAGFPSAAATDNFTVQYQNQITQVSNRLDLNYGLQYVQNQVTTRYNIDNIAPATVDAVTFIPAADQDVYVMSYQSAKGAVNSAVIAKG